MKTNNFRIAFCTDFSAKRLNTFLFNIWNFNASVDIIHIIEDEEFSRQNISELKASLKHQENHFGTFEFIIFEKHERDKLLLHLNSERYAGINIGLIGKRPKKEFGYFVNMVYTQINNDVVIIPPMNSERIHNRIAILLEKDHVEYLYLIRKYGDFLRFNYSKLTFVMKCTPGSSRTVDTAFENKIKQIVPGLNYHIHLLEEEDSKSFLIKLVKDKRNDFYVLFSEDFFFDFSMEYFSNNRDFSHLDAPILKFTVAQEKIEAYKNNTENAMIFELKDI